MRDFPGPVLFTDEIRDGVLGFELEDFGLLVLVSVVLFMELEGDLPILTDEILVELSNEEVAFVVVAVEEAREEDLDDRIGLGTFRELPGNFDTGTPLPAIVK